jgi:hypothetical protein
MRPELVTGPQTLLRIRALCRRPSEVIVEFVFVVESGSLRPASVDFLRGSREEVVEVVRTSRRRY